MTIDQCVVADRDGYGVHHDDLFWKGQYCARELNEGSATMNLKQYGGPDDFSILFPASESLEIFGDRGRPSGKNLSGRS